MFFSEIVKCPTSVFIGRGGEIVGSRFSHALPKLFRKPIKKHFKNHPQITHKTIETFNEKPIGFSLKHMLVFQ